MSGLNSATTLQAVRQSPSLQLETEIEQLFQRRPQPGFEFQPFSAAEYEECRRLVECSGRVTAHHLLQAPKFSVLTEFPPSITGQGSQRDYEDQFSCAAVSLAEALLTSAMRDPDSSIVVPVWRAGLCFAEADTEPAGFWHIGAARDPKTLRSSFYFDSLSDTRSMHGINAVLCDPMVGTGYTMIDVIDRVKASGVSEDRISVLAMFMTPEAAVRLLCRFPEIQLHAACLDCYLNEKGWILPNRDGLFLGDFGDLFSARGLSQERVSRLIDKGALDEESLAALNRRLGTSF